MLVLNNQRYLGLSLPLLEDAFAGNAQPFDFVGKLFFTVLSLGAGFQGGEVTPLFEIGATLGSSLALCYIYQFLFSRFRIYWCFLAPRIRRLLVSLWELNYLVVKRRSIFHGLLNQFYVFRK